MPISYYKLQVLNNVMNQISNERTMKGLRLAKVGYVGWTVAVADASWAASYPAVLIQSG